MKKTVNPFRITTLADELDLYFSECSRWFEENSHHIARGFLGIVVTLILFLLMLFLLRKVAVPLLARKKPSVAETVRTISVHLSLLVLWTGLSGSVDLMNLPNHVDLVMDKIFCALLVFTALALVLHGVRCVAEILSERLRKKDSENKLLLDLFHSLIKLVAWSLAVFFILQNVFMMNVTHLLVSAGVLGLAIAFAAQNTVANLFGAFSILGCKLFKVGDWIRVDKSEGIVERIGFRSVRLRAFEGRLIDIPNRIIADSQLENYSNREFWREHFCFGLIYQTSPEKIEQARHILEEIGRDLADDMAPGKSVRFSFLQFDASSLNVDGYVWFRISDWFTMRSSRSRFNGEVLRRFNEAGLEFAYPTSTIFLQEEAAEQPLPIPHDQQ
ncbi:MAG: mechanosensitive ion channel family protein [Lentisphaeria bacterium]|nr:mechanosensitive ion channel family protein [Lentisphaeria bacterium]